MGVTQELSCDRCVFTEVSERFCYSCLWPGIKPNYSYTAGEVDEAS